MNFLPIPVRWCFEVYALAENLSASRSRESSRPSSRKLPRIPRRMCTRAGNSRALRTRCVDTVHCTWRISCWLNQTTHCIRVQENRKKKNTFFGKFLCEKFSSPNETIVNLRGVKTRAVRNSTTCFRVEMETRERSTSRGNKITIRMLFRNFVNHLEIHFTGSSRMAMWMKFINRSEISYRRFLLLLRILVA